MKNLVILSQSDDYTVSSLIRYLIKMFYEKSVIEIFKSYQINIITSNYIKNILKKTEEDFLTEIENKNDYIIFGIHPYGWQIAIKYGKDIKKIMWQDDLHYFAHFIDKKGASVQKFSEKYEPIYIGDVDYLMTPSSKYFKNLGITEFDDKIIDYFYFLNESSYSEIDNSKFEDRINSIVLSGELTSGYKSRVEFSKLLEKKLFKNKIHIINHPGYENNEHMTELNYYKELSKYKAAFVGHYVFPLNFLLAKHIEVLMCGCIGFFEPNSLLKDQLGLIEYVHYVPCFDENGLIKDVSFYNKWIESEEGVKIANQGKDYVRKKFGKEYINNFANLISKLY